MLSRCCNTNIHRNNLKEALNEIDNAISNKLEIEANKNECQQVEIYQDPMKIDILECADMYF